MRIISGTQALINISCYWRKERNGIVIADLSFWVDVDTYISGDNDCWKGIEDPWAHRRSIFLSTHKWRP